MKPKKIIKVIILFILLFWIIDSLPIIRNIIMFQKHIEHYSEQAIQYLAENVAESNDKVFIKKAMFDHVSCYDLEKDIYKKNRAIFSIFELPHKRFDIYIAVEDKCYVVTFEKIAKNEYVIIHSTEDGSV